MKVKCELELDMEDEAAARNIANSIKVDDDSFVLTEVIGNRILARMESDTIPSLIHTIEDYMACISIAEKSIKD